MGLGNDLVWAKPSASGAGSSQGASSTSSFSYSSKVSGGTVTIYGNSTTKTQTNKPAASKTAATKTSAKTNSAPKQTTISKPVSKPQAPATRSVVKAASKPPSQVASKKPAIKSTITTLLRSAVKPVVPVKLRPPVLKPTVPKVMVPLKTVANKKAVIIRLPASASGKITAASGEASFAPNEVTANAFPPSVAVGEPVFLASSAAQHYRTGQILNKATEVRFTPISTSWAFSDGEMAIGSSSMRSFASPGTYLASVTVRYLVSYRFAGQTTWTTEPGTIELTDKVQVKVTAQSSEDGAVSLPPDSGAQKPYLVGSNCLQRPMAFGCGNGQ